MLLAMLLSLGPLQGCYYWQAARGHVGLMAAREPIDAVIADPDTPGHVRERLLDVAAARAFAIDVLGLPDNGSYTSYVDLGRDYVVVNVFAAPEFSLQPKRWCYPFVGCMAYRGYFSARKAEACAARLGEAGYDTTTSKVRAYSTLGRFRDPVLSTMIAGSADAAAALVFHELAHQVVYVRDDTAFNESFASFVAAEGMRRWRAQRGLAASPAAGASRRAALLAALERLRTSLRTLYASDRDDAEKRAGKAALFEDFAVEWTMLGGRPPAPGNNAALLPIALYADRTDAFAALLRENGDELGAFYAAVRALAGLDRPERDRQLDALAAAR